MFSTFRMGPTATGRGLCDIDSQEYPGKILKKLESTCKAELNRFLVKTQIIGLIQPCQDFPAFLYFSGVHLTILYRYHTVRVCWLSGPYEMPKAWNLSYLWTFTFLTDWCYCFDQAMLKQHQIDFLLVFYLSFSFCLFSFLLYLSFSSSFYLWYFLLDLDLHFDLG